MDDTTSLEIPAINKRGVLEDVREYFGPISAFGGLTALLGSTVFLYGYGRAPPFGARPPATHSARTQYESAVRKLMIDVPEALDFVRGLFGTLAADLVAA
jgi:hypothetical protein